MRVSVVIVTYRRAWSLGYALESLVRQSRPPDEVVVVLKPSGDGSEEVLRQYQDKLPIRVIIQERGNVTDAVEMGYRSATGDLVLYMDDDAVAHEEWVRRYVSFFADVKDAGGAGGVTYRALYTNGEIEKTELIMYPEAPTKNIFYRKPLRFFQGYCGWISKSGFMGLRSCQEPIVRSSDISGVNMGWRKEAIEDCPLSSLYRKSKRGFWFEQTLALCARRKGYHTYVFRDPSIAPIVWHIQHIDSLTRKPGFWSEFWIHYDRVANFWRLKKLGADVSYPAYFAAIIVSLRRKPLPRLLATLYGLITRT